MFEIRSQVRRKYQRLGFKALVGMITPICELIIFMVVVSYNVNNMLSGIGWNNKISSSQQCGFQGAVVRGVKLDSREMFHGRRHC